MQRFGQINSQKNQLENEEDELDENESKMKPIDIKAREAKLHEMMIMEEKFIDLKSESSIQGSCCPPEKFNTANFGDDDQNGIDVASDSKIH